MIQIDLFIKENQRLREKTYDCRRQRIRVGGRDSWGIGDGHGFTALFKVDDQQGPAVQHRELCSMFCGSLDRRGVWGEWKNVSVDLSPFAIHLKLSQHC